MFPVYIKVDLDEIKLLQRIVADTLAEAPREIDFQSFFSLHNPRNIVFMKLTSCRRVSGGMPYDRIQSNSLAAPSAALADLFAKLPKVATLSCEGSVIELITCKVGSLVHTLPCAAVPLPHPHPPTLNVVLTSIHHLLFCSVELAGTKLDACSV